MRLTVLFVFLLFFHDTYCQQSSNEALTKLNETIHASARYDLEKD